MAAKNENVPMLLDGEADEEDYTADAAAEAFEETLDAGDFPTAAEMATLRPLLLIASMFAFRMHLAL